MTVSFAVTAYEETSRGGPTILDSIDAAVKHPLIDEIVVVDDHSTDYDGLVGLLDGVPKVKTFRNIKNLGVFGNKLSAVAHSTGDWVMNCDSDNVFSSEILDLVLSLNLDSETWYCPSFAKPQFDYRPYLGSYHAENFGEAVKQGGMFNCFVNTGNQTVNRAKYMEVFGRYQNERADLMMPNFLGTDEGEREKIHWRRVFDACDSFIFNLEWLKSGGTLEVVDGFEYEHFYTEGDDSNYNRAPVEKGSLNDVLLGLAASMTIESVQI